MGLKILMSSLLHEVLFERLVIYSPVSLCVIACLPLDCMKISELLHLSRPIVYWSFNCITTVLNVMLHSYVVSTASTWIFNYI